MTMSKRDSSSIWSLVREDRDVDDLIFAGESINVYILHKHLMGQT